VPGDSDRKLSHAPGAGADALILDLEDAVTPQRQPIARQMVAEFLRSVAPGAGPPCWVRINPLVTAVAREDLAAILPNRPAGIVLPKAAGPDEVRTLAGLLDQHDPALHIGIVPIVTETASAVLRLVDYHEPLPRVRALTWGVEDLSTVVGARATGGSDGALLPVFRHAEALVLLAAAALGVPALDGIFAAHHDIEGLQQRIAAARAQGFGGMLAIHPRQLAIINAGFEPTAGEIAHAQRVVQAFAAARGAGVVVLDGRMFDRPHLRRAERLLASLDVISAGRPAG